MWAGAARYTGGMYRAIIYDFDGVIRHWDEDETRAIEARFGLPHGAIAAVAFDPALMDRALTGRIPFETWLLAIGNALGREYGAEAAGAATAWSERRGRIDPEMAALAAETRKRLRTALLSNATTRLEEDLQYHKLDQAFDVIVNSARTGFMKPDPVIYRITAARLGFLPEECIAIDDAPANVEAARAFGMTAIAFEGIGPLRERLADLIP